MIDNKEYPCDPWHLEFPKEMLQEYKKEIKFWKLVVEKLPEINLPIDIGCTGYVYLTKPVNNSDDGWCYDSVGRVVAKIDNWIMFMRGINRPLVMCMNLSNRGGWKQSLSNQMRGEVINNLIKKLDEKEVEEETNIDGWNLL